MLLSTLAAEATFPGWGEDIAAGDHPKLFVLGYLDAGLLPLTIADPVTTARNAIGEHARLHRLTLGNIYVDYPDLGGSRFRALVTSIERFNPQFVIIPDPDHLDVKTTIAKPGEDPVEATRREHIEATTARARFLNEGPA